MKKFISLMMLLVAAPVGAAVTAATGYALRTIPTPGNVQGAVAQSGDAILVGQGTFGGGTESIIRIDSDGVTTIATGFNSLGGFDLAADGTLYVADNCGECAGAVTGDTLFAIPDALERTTSVTALGHEVVAAGSIPAAQDVLIMGDGAVLVSDARGIAIGKIVRVSGGMATDLITGLDLVAGLARDATTLYVGNLDGVTFVGEILRYTLAGAPLTALVTGLSGEYGNVVDSDGFVLASGGFADDFSSTVIAVASNGDITERARGFGFTGELWWNAARDEVLVLDFGVSQVTAICRDQDGDEVCDADDNCVLADNADQADADDDGIGDACELCLGGAPGSKVKLALSKLAAPAGDDALSFKGNLTFGAPPDIAPETTGVRIVVQGPQGPIVDAVIPGGLYDKPTKTGWKAKNGKFSWKGATGIDGITKVAIKKSSKVPGLVSFVVSGKTGSYAVTLADLPLAGILRLGPDAGECGEAEFPGPPTGPTCVAQLAKGKVSCK